MLGRTLMRTVVYPVADRLFAWRSPTLERELEWFQWLDPETIRRHLGQDGAPLVPGEVGRLIVTDLANRITPIIRYDIGDLASLAPPGRCSCGRGLATLQTLQGRHEDFVRFRSGHRVSAAYLYPPIRRYLGLWWEYQFVQTDPDRLVLSVVPKSPGGGFGPQGARRLQKVLREALGEPMNVVVRTVDRIPFEPSGKRPFLKPLSAESQVQRP